ncbi:MAG TPA: OmpH family outer membrane protein [Pyrinomonadaceae bacterium]|nr:OmpH family outer membrane protein [Pyrinomonadaceae bacterium]
MIRKYLFPLSALIVVAVATSAATFAQAPAGARPTPTPAAGTPAATQAAPTVALPMSKMAIIYTDLFLDPKTGIAKFNSVLTKLNGEFQKTKDEIQAMQTRGQTLEAEVTKLRDAPAGTPIDNTALQTKIDQLEQLKKDIQRKAEDAQVAYNKRRQELFSPLQTEVGRALEAFAKARGINVIIDGAQVPLLYAAESTDITRAFIADFNSKNPVTAATTTPQ